VKRLGWIPAFLDPGWLFVIAGLAMCAAVIIIPAENSLQALRQQVGQLKEEESLLAARLSAHASFLDELRRGEPALVRRLAAAQLNLVPEGERPVLLVRSASASVEDWIERTVREEAAASPRPARSVLAMLTEGPQRLWVLGGSILSVFIGLLIGPSISRARPAGVVEAEAPDGAQRGMDGRAEAAERAVERAGLRSATALAGSVLEPQPATLISAEPVGATAGAGDRIAFCSDESSGPAGDEAVAGECPADPAFCADDVGALLVTNDIEDEVDVLDEDEVEPSSGSAGGNRSAHEAGLTADGPGEATEEEASETGEAEQSAAGVSPGEDDEEDEYECIYEEVEDDGEPAAAEDVEYIYEDADEAADPALPEDEDEEYEYEYEYVYVDEPEAEGEGSEATDGGIDPPDDGPKSERGRRGGKRGSRGRR